MQAISNVRRLSRVFGPPISAHSARFLSSDLPTTEAPRRCHQQWRNHSVLSSQSARSSGSLHGSHWSITEYVGQCLLDRMNGSSRARAWFATAVEARPTEAVKELYDKMKKSLNARTMPPNAWLWSLIENCANHEDAKLLFDILQNLRVFRLSNLRIHADFNCNLCREVAKACVRVGAIELGKKALWKHNVYGLSPSVGSAHHLLLYAKENKDVKLMVEIMKLLKRNDLPLQAGTADIVFSICYNTDNWKLISKYSKRFLKAGVKLRRTTFNTWMEFAAKIGDTETLWKVEKLRSDTMKRHSVATGLSCAKGFLLEHKPENAAAIIQDLNQNLSDAKRQGLAAELQRLVNEWPFEVIKHQKEEDRKALAAAFKTDIPAMVSSLLSMGLEVTTNIGDLTEKAELC